MKPRLVLALVAGGLGACGGKDTVEPPAELVSFEETLNVSQLWKHKVGNGSERLRLGLAPVSDGSRVFAGALDGTAEAISLLDGEILWTTDTDFPLAAGPGVGGGIVVFGTSNGSLVALEADTGELRWEQAVGSEVLAPPAVSPDLVAFRTVNGRLNAASGTTGRELWTVLQTTPLLTLRGNSAPIIANNTIVAGFDNGRVASYDVEEGFTRWERALATASGRTEIERLVDVGVDLEVLGSTVYAASFQGRAAAIDLGTGVVLWERRLSSFTGIGVDTRNVYVTDDVSTIIALDRQTGTEIWRQSALRLRDVTAAVRHRGALVVGDYDGYVHWLDIDDGSFLARRRVAAAQISAKPLAVGPLLFIQSEDGTLTAFEIVEESEAESD
jgi:outer membrane protein assembly factor BamB